MKRHLRYISLKYLKCLNHRPISILKDDNWTRDYERKTFNWCSWTPNEPLTESGHIYKIHQRFPDQLYLKINSHTKASISEKKMCSFLFVTEMSKYLRDPKQDIKTTLPNFCQLYRNKSNPTVAIPSNYLSNSKQLSTELYDIIRK